MNKFYVHISDAEDKFRGFRKALSSSCGYRALLPPNQHCFCLDTWGNHGRRRGFLRTKSDEEYYIFTCTLYCHRALVILDFSSSEDYNRKCSHLYVSIYNVMQI